MVISSRKQANVDKALSILRKEGFQNVSGIVCHVRQPHTHHLPHTATQVGDVSQLRALVQHAVDAHGGLDVVVSNAAVNPAVGPILELEPSVVDKLFSINVVAAINLLRLAVPHMRPGGAIVLVSSYAAYAPTQV